MTRLSLTSVNERTSMKTYNYNGSIRRTGGSRKSPAHRRPPGLFPSSFERMGLPSRCRAACHVGGDGLDNVAEVIELTVGVQAFTRSSLCLEHVDHGFSRGVLCER